MNIGVFLIAASVLAATSPASAAGGVTLPLPAGCELVGSDRLNSMTKPSRASFPPVQMEIRTPFEPTVFAAGGYSYLLYELHLQNFSDDVFSLKSIEVLDAGSQTPIASFSGERLSEKVVPAGEDKQAVQAGGRAIAFICLAFDSGSAPPGKLFHRVLFAEAVAEGPVIATRNRQPKVLAPSVSGADWMAVSGLSIGSHHRSGLFVAGGLAQISRRYAVDWKRKKQGAFFSGDARDPRSYYAYDQDVLAVADSKVVVATDRFPDNSPRTVAGFNTAVPITMDSVAGNSVVLDIGNGQFAYYAHLKPGSLRVKVGDRVRRGQSLAKIGNSGDAREPHLHFQVTTGPEILASEGLPYVIDRFRLKAADGSVHDRKLEFPLGNVLIDLAPTKACTIDGGKGSLADACR